MTNTTKNKICSCGCGKIIKGVSQIDALVFATDECADKYFSEEANKE